MSYTYKNSNASVWLIHRRPLIIKESERLTETEIDELISYGPHVCDLFDEMVKLYPKPKTILNRFIRNIGGKFLKEKLNNHYDPRKSCDCHLCKGDLTNGKSSEKTC